VEFRVGKSLFPDDIHSVYEVEEQYFPAGSTTIEVLRGLKDAIRAVIGNRLRRTPTDYSAMKYEELRRIANDDAIAESMSDEEYESLSAVMWKKFSAEKGLR
jgi:hypothetical protein